MRMLAGRLDRETKHWDEVANAELEGELSLLRVSMDDLSDRTKSWLPLIDIPMLTEALIAKLGDLRGHHILDVGTGNGFLATALALRGARVTAVDVSPVSLKVARQRAALNGVEDRIEFAEMPAEQMDLPDASFDAACGIFVLHHTDLDASGRELGRLLKPGAPAVFIETMAFNPLLMAARRHVSGRFGVEKASSEDEAPIGQAGLERLRAGFPGTVNVEWPAVVFARMLGYLPLFRSSFAWMLLKGADQAIAGLPVLRPMSYFGLVVMQNTVAGGCEQVRFPKDQPVSVK